MKEEFYRSAMLLGEEAIEKITTSRVIVFGAGGVGSFAIEALARMGVGRLDVVDSDTVARSNLNRQLIALNSTIGRKKVDVVKERVFDISPTTEIQAFDIFYDNDTKDRVNLSEYDYIVDAIDSMESKVLLIKSAAALGVPIISALSTGNKLDPTLFRVDDIYKTSVCPIAKILRKRLREEGVESLRVIYSTEQPITSKVSSAEDTKRKSIGSVPFVPSVVGLMLAREVILDIIGEL